MAKSLPGLLAVHMPARFESDPIIGELFESAARIAGGFTLNSVRGGYVREDTGQLQVEPITVLIVNHEDNLHESIKGLRHNIVRRLFELGEESVMVSYSYPYPYRQGMFRGLIFNDKERVVAPPRCCSVSSRHCSSACSHGGRSADLK